jgi:hypothetical protein
MSPMHLLYGRKADDADWQEQLLYTADSADKFRNTVEHVKGLARKDGFAVFRVAMHNGEQPNFAATLNRKEGMS